MTRSYDIVLIDEPEAFLHPPQARLLGEIFVDLSRRGVQLIVSTHSDDFLQGVLSASATSVDVSIVRLTRPTPTVNAVAQISSPSLRRLYEDPLLRYSNILNGIFYKGVVFCEAEADCKYYSAVLDSLYGAAEPRPDILFTQVGGKDRFAKGVSALLAAKVPTAVIADLDLLADQAKFDELFSLLGGDPSSLGGHLNVLSAWVRSQARGVDRAFASYMLTELLAASGDTLLSGEESKEIRRIVKATSGWDLVKTHGRQALANGGPTTAFDNILRATQEVGLFLVPVGELERFHPEVGGTKQQWLRRVFEDNKFAASATAAEFVRRVASHVASLQ
jgi:hypothetical protein